MSPSSGDLLEAVLAPIDLERGRLKWNRTEEDAIDGARLRGNGLIFRNAAADGFSTEAGENIVRCGPVKVSGVVVVLVVVVVAVVVVVVVVMVLLLCFGYLLSS
jgi:hypothetical protein